MMMMIYPTRVYLSPKQLTTEVSHLCSVDLAVIHCSYEPGEDHQISRQPTIRSDAVDEQPTT